MTETIDYTARADLFERAAADLESHSISNLEERLAEHGDGSLMDEISFGSALVSIANQLSAVRLYKDLAERNRTMAEAVEFNEAHPL